MSKATSPADESLVAAIASSSLLRDFLHIVDCRPMTTAMVRVQDQLGLKWEACGLTVCNLLVDSL